MKQIKHFWVVLVLLGYSCYSYSEIIHGRSEEATNGNLNWVMSNVLPSVSGLSVNSVIYRYTTIKQTEDDMTVHVQNENVMSSGYIFRETDSWNGLPGNTITKAVPVPNIESKYWGNGSIEVEGEGQVVNPTVIYSYIHDTCAEPTTDVRCPNYKADYSIPLTTLTVYDPLSDENVRNAMNNKTDLDDEEENNKKPLIDSSSKKGKKAVIVKDAGNGSITADAAMKAIEFQAMTIANFSSYTFTIPGGVYPETVQLKDKKLPDNRRGLINTWSQQILHERMIDSQYNKTNKQEK